MKPALAALLLLTLTACTTTWSPPRTAGIHPPRLHPVLLVLDLQQDYLGPDPRMAVDRTQVVGVLKTAEALVTAFRAAGRPVVYLRNEFPRSDVVFNLFRNGATVEGTPGTRWVGPAAAPDLWVVKKASDGFTEPALAAFLRDREADSVVVVGVFGEPLNCVPATAIGALAHGLSATVVPEGVGTGSAAQLEPALRSMELSGVRIQPLAALLAELKP